MSTRNSGSIRKRMLSVFLSIVLMILLLSLWYVFGFEYSVGVLNGVIDAQNVRSAYSSTLQALRRDLDYGDDVESALAGHAEALKAYAAKMYAAYPYRAVYDLLAITDRFEGQVQAHREAPEGIYDSISQMELVFAGLSDVVEHADTAGRERIKTYRISAIQAFVAIAAGCALMCVVIIKGFSDSIVQPIEQMATAAKRVSGSDYDAAMLPDSPRADEIGYLFSAFNRMVREIQAQIETVRLNADLKQQLQAQQISAIRQLQLLNEAELNMLQSQVNPHFLFNCMSLIRQTAYLEQAKETGEITEVFSEMLRYGLYRLNQIVTIRDEIGDAKNYCFLMEKRFGDRIRYHISAEEACLSEKIPCRVLQPLIENAYKHGLENVTEDGVLNVSVSSMDGRILVRVEDNGRGMRPDQLRQIEESISSDEISADSKRHIGLANVIKRMLLFCNGDLRYRIVSTPNESTIVAFSFPPLSEWR